jgi:hypothetical protein
MPDRPVTVPRRAVFTRVTLIRVTLIRVALIRVALIRVALIRVASVSAASVSAASVSAASVSAALIHVVSIDEAVNLRPTVLPPHPLCKRWDRPHRLEPGDAIAYIAPAVASARAAGGRTAAGRDRVLSKLTSPGGSP